MLQVLRFLIGRLWVARGAGFACGLLVVGAEWLVAGVLSWLGGMLFQATYRVLWAGHVCPWRVNVWAEMGVIVLFIVLMVWCEGMRVVGGISVAMSSVAQRRR